MKEDNFGKFIKEIRKKNNLTQKDLADKYNVTYQAVSKWENNKNMPDIGLIKQMSEDFNISLEEMFDGEIKHTTKNNKLFVIAISIILFITLAIIIFISVNNNDFEFKTLSSNCDNFSISGSVSYNDKKTSIYITNIKYCGGNDTKEYKEIECILYESHNNLEKKISNYKYNADKNILLEDFLQKVTLTVDDYKQVCKEYNENSLYLLINAKDNEDKITSYKIPLILEDNCN